MEKQINPVLVVLSIIIGICLIFLSCSKSNETDLQKTDPGSGCDTVNMTYATNVEPIIAANCYSCHGDGASQPDGIKLQGYTNLKKQADNGNLIGTITHASGFPAMPFNLPKLSDCDINKIKDWISRGALNN